LTIDVVPIPLPTGWKVGPVTAYLFPDTPVTLIDAGNNNEETEKALQNAFDEASLSLADLKRIIVTHSHTDHYGSAAWLQEKSNCEVMIHKDDASYLDPEWDWRATVKELFVGIGVPQEILERYGQRSWDRPKSPTLIQLDGDEVIPTGGTQLQIQHHPGHSPGHIWAFDESNAALFVGDYLLANSPTNAGMQPDPDETLGTKPMLKRYDAGLEAMRSVPAQTVFPAHGPVINDHKSLIDKRLAKSRERTERVLEAVREAGDDVTPAQLTLNLYGERIMSEPFAFISDVVGRLQMLIEVGKVDAKLKNNVWRVSTA
jgi:glyoxylase-like metal-dependent hydrolase (beta-lactamase superfamily II)